MYNICIFYMYICTRSSIHGCGSYMKYYIIIYIILYMFQYIWIIGAAFMDMKFILLHTNNIINIYKIGAALWIWVISNVFLCICLTFWGGFLLWLCASPLTFWTSSYLAAVLKQWAFRLSPPYNNTSFESPRSPALIWLPFTVWPTATVQLSRCKSQPLALNS